MIQKILNLPTQYLVLALAGFIVVLSFVIPAILKLTKKKNGYFRTSFLVGGMLVAFLMLILASFIAIFSVSIKLFLKALGKGILILVVVLASVAFFERFLDWISKD